MLSAAACIGYFGFIRPGNLPSQTPLNPLQSRPLMLLSTTTPTSRWSVCCSIGLRWICKARECSYTWAGLNLRYALWLPCLATWQFAQQGRALFLYSWKAPPSPGQFRAGSQLSTKYGPHQPSTLLRPQLPDKCGHHGSPGWSASLYDKDAQTVDIRCLPSLCADAIGNPSSMQ